MEVLYSKVGGLLSCFSIEKEKNKNKKKRKKKEKKKTHLEWLPLTMARIHTRISSLTEVQFKLTQAHQSKHMSPTKSLSSESQCSAPSLHCSELPAAHVFFPPGHACRVPCMARPVTPLSAGCKYLRVSWWRSGGTVAHYYHLNSL